MDTPDDRELMRAAQAGSDAAFGSLVRRHQKRIYRLAIHMLGNAAEAEDVSQDTFVRAYRALERFDGRSQPFTWFYRIAVNLCLNTIRARKKHSRSTPHDDPRLQGALVEERPSMGDPGLAATNRQIASILCDAIDSLSETLRTTLVLVAVDGLSHAEAAETLGCPEGTIAWRVHEARRKLKAVLDERIQISREAQR